MSRWKAAAIHLSISAAIGLLSAALIFGVWYPAPYRTATGADELVLLLMGVDIVLGPLLTLVVFKSGKKSLRFDLGVIALMQVCAFAYGTSVVVRARPAFIVGALDRFVLVTATELDAADLAAGSAPAFRSVPWTGPMLVGVAMPTETSDKNDLMYSGTAGKDVERFPKYYADYATSAAGLLAKAHPLEELRGKSPKAASLVEAWLQAHPRDAASVRWLPMTVPREALTMLMDAESGEPLDALPIDSW